MCGARVRRAREEEAPALLLLLSGTAEILRATPGDHFPGYYSSVARLAHEIGAPPSGDGWLGWWISEEAETVVGAGAGGVPRAGEGEVYCLFVRTEYRRRGHGSVLLAAITDQQRERDAVRQWANVDNRDQDACRFLSARGFALDSDATRAWRFIETVGGARTVPG